MITYIATMLAASLAFPIWGWTLGRLDDRYRPGPRAQWVALIAASALSGAAVAAVPLIVQAVSA